MKKRMYVLGMAAVLSMALFTGCSSAKKDYENDLKELNGDIAEDLEDPDELKDSIKDWNLKTSEGKAIKEDLMDLMDVLSDAMAIDENTSEDEVDKLQEDIEKLEDKINDDVDDFKDAAEDAGIDKADLADLEF